MKVVCEEYKFLVSSYVNKIGKKKQADLNLYSK
jgi:hypothetical protein